MAEHTRMEWLNHPDMPARCSLCDEPWPCKDAELADLQRQLREAQKERDGWKRLADYAVPRMEAAENCVRTALRLFEDFQAERDAAIKRGKQVWQIARFYKRQAKAAEALAEEMAEHLHQQLRGFPPVADVLRRWQAWKRGER